MRYQVDPSQNYLFDPVGDVLNEKARARLENDWPGLFRESILAVMPVDIIGGAFDPTMGRPTKELYSMCGLLLLTEFHNWTIEEAVNQYVYNMRVHYALNLPSRDLSLSSRTLERYRAIFRERDVAAAIMREVTSELVERLGLSVEKQRLDSTHIFSNMASWGRTRLMTEVVRRFLIQLKRHEPELHGELPAELLDRYAKKNGWNLGAKADEDAKRLARQTVAEDMFALVTLFENVDRVASRTTFKDMARVFGEQCEVVEGKVEVKAKSSATCLQNPSDPDASYDGHKGQGYQAQMVETSSEDNPVQLVLDVIPQTASEQDADAVEPMLDSLDDKGFKPNEITADTAYGSDANVEACAARGVDLVSPTTKSHKDHLKLEDFERDDQIITRCPAGHEPLSSAFDAETGKGRASFDGTTCAACPQRDKCPTFRHGKRQVITYDEKQLRLSERRKDEATPEFKERYAPRAGIEALFSHLKSMTGLGRLRVRGKKAVHMAILLKVAGYNIYQAAKALAKGQKPGISSFWALIAMALVAILARWLIGSRKFKRNGENLATMEMEFIAA